LLVEIRLDIPLLLNKYIDLMNKLKENSKIFERISFKNTFDYVRTIIYEKITETNFHLAVHILGEIIYN